MLEQINTKVVVDSKCREMRDNLVFTNIGEVLETNSSGILHENTEQVLTGFLATKLRLDNIKFERVHRVPTNHVPDRVGPRPIVAKFTYFKDREAVRRSCSMLKGTNYGINEQFPEEIKKKRRDL